MQSGRSALSLLGILCFFFGLGEVEAQEQRIRYGGVASLFTLDQVTVIYPAGDPELLDRNRSSAERRAAFLTQVHGLDASVAADSGVDEKILEGSLLLLGWDNSVLLDHNLPNPVRCTAEGCRLLDVIEVTENEDVAYACPSPFNPDQRLVFWSRIDPELDRYWVLPFLGSDWATVRDFATSKTGMFHHVHDWPPARNEDAEAGLVRVIAPLPLSRASEHYTLHHASGTLADDEAEQVLAAREKALRVAMERLGRPGPGFRIDLFVYPDADDKKEKTGSSDEVHNLARRRQLHMTRQFARSSNPHEDSHLLAYDLFGPCYITALCEGLAGTVEKPIGESTELALFAALMVEQKAIPAIDDLLDEESHRRLSKQSGFVAASLLVSWIRDISGNQGLRRVYGLAHGTADDLARRLDQPPKANKRFKKWVRELARSVEGEFRFRKAEADARTLRDSGDPIGSAAALTRALKFKPDDPKTLYKLALAQMESEAYEPAEKTLDRLLVLLPESDDSPYVIFGHYQRGRLLQIQGRQEIATEAFHRVLDLPDRNDAHRLAREALGEAGESRAEAER